MILFALRRVLVMIPVLLGVLFIVFTLSQFMPGDPVINKLGADYTAEQYAAAEHAMGLDKPFFVQFWDYLVGVATHFDLGTSYQSNREVSTMVFERIGVTLKLGILSSLFTLALGVPLGIMSAIKQYSVTDFTVTTLSLVLASMPGFWLAMVMMIAFSLVLGILPSSGIGTWQHWVMPVLAQGLMPLAAITRMTRSSMLEVIRQDYIRTAFSKGLPESAVIRRHALKNALIPIITVFGFQMSMIFGGSIVIEMIFSMPGMGTLLMAAINSRDYPTIMGVVFMISLCVCIINLIVDLVYAAVDPRIKAQFEVKRREKRPGPQEAGAKI
jgi:peptide/nickel transport system permease protein